MTTVKIRIVPIPIFGHFWLFGFSLEVNRTKKD